MADGLKLVGWKKRKSASYTHIVACRYPRDEKEVADTRIKRMSKKREADGLDPYLTPEEACRPRLERELAWQLERKANLLLMGAEALKGIVPGNPKISSYRGFPLYLDTAWRPIMWGDDRAPTARALVTFDPSAVLRGARRRPYFRRDVAKAKRHFEGTLDWFEPHVVVGPTPMELWNAAKIWIEKAGTGQYTIAYDWETTRADDILLCEPKCLGIGTEDVAYVIPWISMETGEDWYSVEEFDRMRRVLQKILTHPRLMKVGWNSGYFDRIITENCLKVTPKPHIDGILLHRLHNCEVAHRLNFVGAEFTDAPAWKSEHAGADAATDAELHHYNGRDVAVTRRAVRPLVHSVRKRRQNHLHQQDHELQSLCVGMKRVGIPIDEAKRVELLEKQTVRRESYYNTIQHLAQGLNPRSPQQVSNLLFDKWKLPLQEITPGGLPSSNDGSLRGLLCSPVVSTERKHFIKALRFYRRADKLITTYLEPWGEMALEDGRIHADYSAHGTPARFSSSNPNFQNVPYDLRAVFVAPEGFKFVYADMDQLELRLCAAVAGATQYIDSFAGTIPIEPHGLTGQAMFGPEYWEIPGAPADRTKKGKGKFKEARDLAKTLCYAALYGAGVNTIHSNLIKREDEQGNLIYANYTVRKVAALHRRWLRAAPQFSEWWGTELESWRQLGYVAEPISGRRRDCADGEDLSVVANWIGQAGGFAIVARGLLALQQRIPFRFSKGIGLCNQTHDSVLYLVPEKRAERTKRIVEECLHQEALGIEFTAEAKILDRWKED